MFNDWTKFEKLFLVFGTIIAVLLTIIFNGTWIDLGYTLLYFWTALLLAKGKYSCYIIGIVSTFFYSYVSFLSPRYLFIYFSVGIPSFPTL